MDALRRARVNDRYRFVVLAWEGWHSQLVEKVAWVRSWAKRLSHACRPAAVVDLRAAVIRAVTFTLVRVGLVCGREDRSVMPARPSAWNRRTHL